METPELDKMRAVKDKSQAIGEFIDWLRQDNCDICEMDDNGHYLPIYQSIEKWLAEYFEIDLNKCEEERRAILDAIREQNEL